MDQYCEKPKLPTGILVIMPDDAERLIEWVSTMLGVLEFYGDTNNWLGSHMSAEEDRGARARAALAQVRKDD